MILAVAASLWILLGPLYSVHETRTLDDHKTNVEREYKMSGLESGARNTFLLLCGLPVLAIWLTLFAPRLRLAVGILLTAFCVVAAMSVGLFYLPSAAMLFLKAPLRIGGLEVRP